MRIGYAAGAFDLFHIGHLNLLRRARAGCDFLIAGVVTDELLVGRKGREPFIPLDERLEIVGALDCVDKAVAETTDKITMCRDLGVSVLFKGDDWRGTLRGRQLEQDLRPLGVEVEYFPYTAHTSSTRLRRTLELFNAAAAPVRRAVDH